MHSSPSSVAARQIKLWEVAAWRALFARRCIFPAVASAGATCELYSADAVKPLYNDYPLGRRDRLCLPACLFGLLLDVRARTYACVCVRDPWTTHPPKPSSLKTKKKMRTAGEERRASPQKRSSSSLFLKTRRAGGQQAISLGGEF